MREIVHRSCRSLASRARAVCRRALRAGLRRAGVRLVLAAPAAASRLARRPPVPLRRRRIRRRSPSPDSPQSRAHRRSPARSPRVRRLRRHGHRQRRARRRPPRARRSSSPSAASRSARLTDATGAYQRRRSRRAAAATWSARLAADRTVSAPRRLRGQAHGQRHARHARPVPAVEVRRQGRAVRLRRRRRASGRPPRRHRGDATRRACATAAPSSAVPLRGVDGFTLTFSLPAAGGLAGALAPDQGRPCAPRRSPPGPPAPTSRACSPACSASPSASPAWAAPSPRQVKDSVMAFQKAYRLLAHLRLQHRRAGASWTAPSPSSRATRALDAHRGRQGPADPHDRQGRQGLRPHLRLHRRHRQHAGGQLPHPAEAPVSPTSGYGGILVRTMGFSATSPSTATRRCRRTRPATAACASPSGPLLDLRPVVGRRGALHLPLADSLRRQALLERDHLGARARRLGVRARCPRARRCGVRPRARLDVRALSSSVRPGGRDERVTTVEVQGRRVGGGHEAASRRGGGRSPSPRPSRGAGWPRLAPRRPG